MRLRLLILCCCIQYGKTDIIVCSEYLISGINGVNDTALTSSSIVETEMDCSPRNARLFFTGGLVENRCGGWQSYYPPDTNQFIQVTFPVDTTVTAVTIQGRYEHHNEWVTSYFLHYSMDNVAWTTLTSPDGIPKLFIGSTDMNTPVTSPVTPNVTARHFRINPQTWKNRITMRFDVSGCQIRKQNDGCVTFIRKIVFLTEEMVNLHTVMTAMSIAPSLGDCASICDKHNTCMSFTYRTANGVQWCTGYSAWIVVPGRIISNMGVFVNQDALDTYGYKQDQETAILYNIIETKKDQANASTSCKTMFTRLMKVNTASKMTSLQNVISGYDVLQHDFRFYVAGAYNTTVWSYRGGIDVINSDLWSPGNPDPGKGHCVMLTQAGLASVDCQQQLFSICGN